MEDKVNYVVIYKNDSNEQVVNNFDDVEKATAFYQQKVSELCDCSLLKVVAESKAPQCKDSFYQVDFVKQDWLNDSESE